MDPNGGAQEIVSLSNHLDQPLKITLESDGDILVLDNLQTIVRVHPLSGAQSVVSAGGMLMNAAGLTAKRQLRRRRRIAPRASNPKPARAAVEGSGTTLQVPLRSPRVQHSTVDSIRRALASWMPCGARPSRRTAPQREDSSCVTDDASGSSSLLPL